MNKLHSKTMTTAIVAIALSAGAPTSAHHQFLQQAFPSAKSHVSGVKEVKLIFEGNADALFSNMKLIQADGRVVAEETQPKASHEMVMPTPPLPPGPYLVEYRVLTMDGDVVKGDFFFTIDGPSGARAQATIAFRQEALA